MTNLRTNVNDERKVVLVTGASSGIGAMVAAKLANEGARVFGTSRHAGEGAAGVEMVRLDVDADASVAECVAYLLDRAGRVDVLVNNAGRATVGAVEEATASEARALFETNFFGVMRVTSAVLPSMRAAGAGHIVNVGSLSGFIGLPFHGVYSASKHALAGYTEALRAEVRPFGVRVSLVEPQAHATGIRMARPENPLAVYDEPRERVESIIRGQIDRGADPARVADTIVAATRGRPRFRYRVGLQAMFAGIARRFLPSALFEAFVRRELRLG